LPIGYAEDSEDLLRFAHADLNVGFVAEARAGVECGALGKKRPDGCPGLSFGVGFLRGALNPVQVIHYSTVQTADNFICARSVGWIDILGNDIPIPLSHRNELVMRKLYGVNSKLRGQIKTFPKFDYRAHD